MLFIGRSWAVCGSEWLMTGSKRMAKVEVKSSTRPNADSSGTTFCGSSALAGTEPILVPSFGGIWYSFCFAAGQGIDVKFHLLIFLRRPAVLCLCFVLQTSLFERLLRGGVSGERSFLSG